MQVDTSKRLSADEALHHKWFDEKEEGKECKIIFYILELLHDVLDGLT